MNNAWETTKANAEAIVSKLTRTHGWRPGEAGFDGFRSKEMSELLAQAPRDPFLRVANASIRGRNETPENILTDARACLAAARLVPANILYDLYRCTNSLLRPPTWLSWHVRTN